MLAALEAPSQQVSLFVEINFRSGPVYLWSGLGSVNWNGQTWTGIGSFLGLATMEDAATVEARGVSILLSGLDPTMVSDCLTEFQLGLPADVYLALWSGGSIIADPLLAWSGRTDQPTFDVHPDTVTISQACENRLVDMNVAIDRRLTNEDQQMTYPGDLGLQFVDAIQEMTLFWGYPNSATNI